MRPLALNKNAGRFWLGVVGLLGVVDYLLAQRGDGSSFSEGNRWLFRTDTDGGKAAFLVTLFGGAGIYAVHILSRKAHS